MSASPSPRAWIRRNPMYLSGRITWCSRIFCRASSHLDQNPLRDSSFPRFMWYVILESEAKRSSSRSSPKFSGRFMASRRAEPPFSLFSHATSLAQCLKAWNGAPESLWRIRGPCVLGFALVVASQSLHLMSQSWKVWLTPSHSGGCPAPPPRLGRSSSLSSSGRLADRPTGRAWTAPTSARRPPRNRRSLRNSRNSSESNGSSSGSTVGAAGCLEPSPPSAGSPSRLPCDDGTRAAMALTPKGRSFCSATTAERQTAVAAPTYVN